MIGADAPWSVAWIFAKIFWLAIATMSAAVLLSFVALGVNAISETLGRCARKAHVGAWRKRRQARRYRA